MRGLFALHFNENSKSGGQKKDLSFVCYCGNSYCGNSSEEKVGVKEKTAKEGLMKEWLKNREQIGAYHQLMKELSLREQSRRLFSAPSTKT